ncbi:MAG: class I SAM-dependent methyltransferase, partial [Bryobacteraceae bacterium]
FSYEWRLWTLPEIREVLAEAGFSRTTVLWQGTDEKTGEGAGEFVPAQRGEADPAWIAYIQAEP